MKLLGLIGGTSYHSTVVYYRKINEMVGEQIGAQGNPPLLLYSMNIELMRSQNTEKINASYLDTALKLEKAGAAAIVICANTPHMVYDFVKPQINIPILHIADAMGTEAKKRGLFKLGLLGNRPTMTKGFIPKILNEKYQIETIIPETKYHSLAHDYISLELTQGIFSEQAKDFFLNQIQLLKKRGVNGVILGCTELPIIIKESDINIPLLSTTDLHIKMAVDFILSA
ncbi:aspartate/glutamate racemase family protein [Nonlabens agnitus]|uniref:Aspartate racemase n=1 Tax=Nonlabens agnitus TaxID=870484 RepID=A0A2S9WR29_9FLAO|nr:amino acid racemase [Nonlabens agnitus]PRP65921.1 aspartate racemase [Nonlabens agnitus]